MEFYQEYHWLASDKDLCFHQAKTLTYVRKWPGIWSENNLDFYQRKGWTCVREPGLVSEDMDLYRRRTWTYIGEGSWPASKKDLGFFQGRPLTFVREWRGIWSENNLNFYHGRTGLVPENLDLYQRTWTCIREVLVSNLDQNIAIVAAIFVVLLSQIFTEHICVKRKL